MTVELLLAKGEDVSVKGGKGFPPLQRAKQFYKEDVVEFLQKHGTEG